MNWLEEEMYHQMEEDALDQPCKYALPTGDKTYPRLCEKDNRYARESDCHNCPDRRLP